MTQEASQNQYCKCIQGIRRIRIVKQIKNKKFWIYPKCVVDLPETRINSREGKSKTISPLGLEHGERKRTIDRDNFITRFYL